MFSIPCTFSGLSLTLDKGGALRFRTRQELSDEDVTALKNSFQSEGIVVFADAPLSSEEQIEVSDKSTKIEGKKSN